MFLLQRLSQFKKGCSLNFFLHPVPENKFYLFIGDVEFLREW
jgi:hypothetical protein